MKRGATGTCIGTPTRRTLRVEIPSLKEKKGFCAHVVAAPLAEVEGPVARSQGPRAEAKATRARGLANPAEDSIRQARFKTEMRAWLAVSDQHAEHMKVRKEKTTSLRKAAKKSATENDVPPPAAPGPRPDSSLC